jgi:outer membrane protein assembly factor BamD (BamD/ComL family)
VRQTPAFLRHNFVMRLSLAPRSAGFLCLLLAAPLAFAQKPFPGAPVPKNGVLATTVYTANLYSTADESGDRIADILPGRELVIVEHNGKWIRVFANTDAPDTREADRPLLTPENEAQPISGWMINKGIVDINTQHGDLILFGAADNAEQAAAVPNPPPHVAEEARLLYRRVAMMYPQSPFTPEALYRAADIRWQIQKADASTLPSAHEKQAYLREQMDEDEMKAIMKYFPRTRWADLAAFDLIDNKLCGDWQGSEKCPEQETGYFLKYVDEHPDSPKAPEALYQAAWREAAAGDMWSEDNNQKRADQDRNFARGVLTRMEQKYPESPFTARTAAMIYKVDQGIPIYGSSRQ